MTWIYCTSKLTAELLPHLMMIGKIKHVHIEMYVKIYIYIYIYIYVSMYVLRHIGTNFIRTLKILIRAPYLLADNLNLFGCNDLNKLRASELKYGIPAVFNCYDLFIWPFVLHYF